MPALANVAGVPVDIMRVVREEVIDRYPTATIAFEVTDEGIVTSVKVHGQEFCRLLKDERAVFIQGVSPAGQVDWCVVPVETITDPAIQNSSAQQVVFTSQLAVTLRGLLGPARVRRAS